MDMVQAINAFLHFENLHFSGFEIYLGATLLVLLPMMTYLWIEHQEY